MTMFSPGDLIDVAQDLFELSDPASEEYFRSILNRCYYSPYGELRKGMESVAPGIFGKSGKHSALVSALAKSVDAHINRIGTRLHHLKTYRERADYEFSAVIVRDDAVVALRRAPTTVDRISKLSKGQWADIIALARSEF